MADGVDAVVPTSEHQYEPLFAVYRKSMLRAINELLSLGGCKISDLFSRCEVRYIKLGAKQFTNLNTMADFKHFREKYDDQF